MQQGRPWTAVRRHARRPQSPVVDKLTAFEAARAVGCRTPEVAGLLNGEPATLEAVQRLALKHYPRQAHVENPESYWLTTTQARGGARRIGPPRPAAPRARARPYVTHRDGVRLMRRARLETLWGTHGRHRTAVALKSVSLE